jgi:threonine/homoserine/homoserine lactone efflux protein
VSVELYLAYVLACLIITVIPGPTVTLIVANSLTHGSRAGLLNVLGTQFGLGLMMLVLAIGLTSIIATMGIWFDWLRLIGAAYLIWIGWKLIRSSGGIAQQADAPRPRGGFVLQGFLVLLGNPKALLWFGAFIPQFIDPSTDYVRQVVLLGLTAMAAAAVSDGGYALLAGGARNLMSKSRVRLISRIGGLCLIGGGAWLAMARTR